MNQPLPFPSRQEDDKGYHLRDVKVIPQGAIGIAMEAHSPGIGYIYECFFHNYVVYGHPFIYLHDWEITKLGEAYAIQD